MLRFRTTPGDFDSRALSLVEINESWDEQVKDNHRKNRDQTIQSIARFYGDFEIDQKVKNFVDMGMKSMSVISFHNNFYQQSRNAFVIGSYYPSLLGVCALTERTLNHLILELRDDFASHKATTEIAEGSSFSSWSKMRRILLEWGVIDADVAATFKKLEGLRHRAIHFNVKTYETVREDACQALVLFNELLQQQFSTFGAQRWFIENTRGVCFVKKSFENDPFVKRFILPSACAVGPAHTIRFGPQGQWIFVDYRPEFYGDKDITDKEFVAAFESVTEAERVNPERDAPV